MSRFLCLIDCLGSGGAERQISYLAILLKKAGHDVDLVVFTKRSKFYDSFLKENNIAPIYNEIGENKYKRIWEIAKYVKTINPDLVIAYKDGVCISSVLAKLFKNFRLVVSERSTTPVLSLKERIKFFLYRFADVIVPNSESQANVIRLYYPNLSDRIKVITNVLDINSFYAIKNRSGSLVPIILTTARVNSKKNILNYLDAINIIRAKGAVCKFWWYGRFSKDDPYAKSVFERISQLKLDDYIEFKNEVSDVNELYHQADYFCLPSTIEGFPNVICEAMACGLPIICSDVCDNPYIVEDGINGFLFNPRKPDEIANSIIKALCLDKKERNIIAQNNRAKIADLCSEIKFIRNYESLL